MSIEQRICLPPRRIATLSSDFRLTIADCEVFCMSGSGRFFVVCKGWRPTRVTGSWLVRPDKKYTFECSSYDECISLFLDLSKEVFRRIPIL